MHESTILIENLLSMWWIAAAAVLAPVLALLTRRTIPDVVWLLVLGMVIGPHALGLADSTEAVAFLRELGLGFLFLLAGFEVNTSDMRSRAGRSAALTWLLCVGLGVGAGLLIAGGDWQIAAVLGIAATSTALGTLLPILKDSGVLGAPLGKATMIHGAFGELLPVVAMSLLLTTRATLQAAAVLVLFAVLAVVIVAVPARLFRKVPLLGRAFAAASDSTMQTIVRITVWVMISLMLLTAVLELDVALGAFAAGLLLHAALRGGAPEHVEEIMHKVEVLGFGLLIPVFFLTSGMSIDVIAVLGVWPLLLGFVGMIVVVRGLPVLARELWTPTGSGLETPREKVALGLYAATGLPIIVAVTQIAASSGLISVTVASAMVTGGAITVLVFPLLASRLSRSPEEAGRAQS
ncbi:potassium transporter Kef [Brachybacterium avium]|uniref:Potassium transporter Kef n=1 Tax=Brachybacterium avium TaxID=2017485 RepID=A0A220UCT0_9MICO|nr:cation:proton antiporter [Brachybacterium avium]ASK65895.1 potassium transporter Kef [Brachybacterium avium]